MKNENPAYSDHKYANYTTAKVISQETSTADYVAMSKEQLVRLTKDILGKNVIDSNGFWFGNIEDIVVGDNFGGFPVVEGFVSKKRFIKWNDVKTLGKGIILNKRAFLIQPEAIAVNKILLGKHILDEQLLNHEDKCVGRIDDLAFMYDHYEKNLRLVGIFSGAGIRLGIEKNCNLIPWTAVSRIKHDNPKAVIVKENTKHQTSFTNKIMVKPMISDYCLCA
jgi:sporulation protein YlmC with PRC-barrel domain